MESSLLIYHVFGDRYENILWRKNKKSTGEAGLTQTELGKATGMTQRRISYIDCDKYEPSMDDLRVLCKFFKVSADYLLDISFNNSINKKEDSR